MPPRRGLATVGTKEVLVVEEKPQGLFERNAHKFVLGGQALAVVSALVLVPIVRRMRAR